MPLLFIIPASKSPTQFSLQFTIPENKAKDAPIPTDPKIIDNKIVNNYLNNNPEESFFFDTDRNTVLPTHHLSIEQRLTVQASDSSLKCTLNLFKGDVSMSSSTQSLFCAVQIANKDDEKMPLHENGNWLYTQKGFPYK
jgi:hypothetical protein